MFVTSQSVPLYEVTFFLLRLQDQHSLAYDSPGWSNPFNRPANTVDGETLSLRTEGVKAAKSVKLTEWVEKRESPRQLVPERRAHPCLAQLPSPIGGRDMHAKGAEHDQVIGETEVHSPANSLSPRAGHYDADRLAVHEDDDRLAVDELRGYAAAPERIVEALKLSGYVVMKGPPAQGGSGGAS